MDYQQWALLRRVGGLSTGPKGYSVGSEFQWRDIMLFVSPDQTYSWLAAVETKVNKMALDKSICKSQNITRCFWIGHLGTKISQINAFFHWRKKQSTSENDIFGNSAEQR